MLRRVEGASWYSPAAARQALGRQPSGSNQPVDLPEAQTEHGGGLFDAQVRRHWAAGRDAHSTTLVFLCSIALSGHPW